jgi:hypothetical protein
MVAIMFDPRKSPNASKAILKLIDAYLPVEACLHYQFLPLSIKGQSILMGMVNPRDPAAINYLRPILSSLNYVCKPQQIDGKTHQKLLGEYLKYLNQQKQPPTPPKVQSANINERPTLITDDPEVKTTQSALVEKIEKKISQSRYVKPTGEPLKTLNIHPCYHLESPESLTKLSPKTLVPELLDRVLGKGIGRVHLERNPQGGTILCSQDGVAKLTLSNLTREFCGLLINEFKAMVSLPLAPLDRDRKLEMMRLYQEEPVLLRWHFMASPYGEELSLQVLRGAALQFYQKYQINQLAEEALQLTEQLERKVQQLKNRSQYTDFLPSQALEKLKAKLDQIKGEIN